MFEIFISVLAVMLASLVGVIFIWKTLRNFVEKRLKFLVSFSAGVFLVLIVGLGSEVLTHIDIWQGMFWIAVGLIATDLLFRFWPNFHHHHIEEEGHKHSRIDERRILFGDSLHNIGDGILIASAYLVNPVLGIGATVGVLIHEIIQEISEFFVLREAGYSTKKALAVNFLVSSSILIGAFGTVLVSNSFSALEIPILAISAGAFLIVVLYDLIPHSVRHLKKEPKYFTHAGFFVLGILLMIVVGNLTGDTHVHGVDDDHAHEHDEHHFEDEHKHEEEYHEEHDENHAHEHEEEGYHEELHDDENHLE